MAAFTPAAYPQTTFAATRLAPDSLLGRRREAVQNTTLTYQLRVLKETGRYEAFKLKWHPIYNDPPEIWPVPKHLFWDSDCAKWLEGACYFVREQGPDAVGDEIVSAIKELVEMIGSAQQEDGYLNIHFTVVAPKERWSNLRDLHEMYNAGHLIEAALAHQDAFDGSDALLKPMLKYVDYIASVFGPESEGKVPGYPGHPELELALLRLHDRTQDPKHLALARFFLTERGNPTGWKGKHYYDVEAERRGDDPRMRPDYYPEKRALWYYQAHKPIKDQQTIEGHAVRATYLLTAAADLLRADDKSKIDPAFATAVTRLWDNMVNKKMYVTGGIGAMQQWEGFGKEYFLPQSSDEGGCYAETCASIAVMMFAQRLLRNGLQAHYADIIELSLYNTVLTSMSADGQGFTYDNQLASSDANLSQRCDWFTVACCPPNVSRLLATLGGYVWNWDETSADAVEIQVHLYVPGTLKFVVGGKTIELTQETQYPWKETVKFTLKGAEEINTTILLRVPEWASGYQVQPAAAATTEKSGYLRLDSSYLKQSPSFSVSIPLKPRLISPHPKTNQPTLTLARGPVVYCVEDVDNEWVSDHFESVQLSPNCKIEEHDIRDAKTGDEFVGLKVTEGASTVDFAGLDARPGLDETALASQLKGSPLKELTFVPYYFRANRGGKGHMRVGLRRKMDCC